MQRTSNVVVSCIATLSLALAACGACQKKTAPPAAAIAIAPAAAAPAPAPATPPPDLTGFWAEYWAPQGRAETQRYVFLADGRFGWLAPQRDTPKVDPLERSGRFTVEGENVVLQIEHQRFGDGRSEDLTTPQRLSLEIGECPPNQEAQAVDTSYVCRSIGGRAFWRRGAPETASAADTEPYLR